MTVFRTLCSESQLLLKGSVLLDTALDTTLIFVYSIQVSSAHQNINLMQSEKAAFARSDRKSTSQLHFHNRIKLSEQALASSFSIRRCKREKLLNYLRIHSSSLHGVGVRNIKSM